ncbi:MAG TPA: TRAP transporter substrate-binding protein DctP [Polyangia bacterium]|nr:TRAP transporter substrate-binding protein DctP [Polyangia bacterium]
MRLVVLVLACLAMPARADEVTLRMGTMAPAGTAWARELNAFAREVESRTSGQVHIKWYFGGITGDEPTMGDRIRRGQLDGAASGGPLCEALAPSMRVMRVVGLLTTQREAAYVAGRLWNIFEAELHKSGMVGLGTTTLGPHILFSRAPIHSLDEFRKTRFWVWDRDDVLRAELASFGADMVALPVADAGRAYDDKRVDGFIAPASVALAFQWSAAARYVTDLRLDYITACVVIADRSFDPLPLAARDVIRSAGGKLAVRFADVGVQQDAMLLNGLFKKQGVTTVPVDPRLSSEFFELARATREKLDAALVPHALLTRVLGILADFRASQPTD